MRLRAWMILAPASCVMLGGAVGCSSCGSSNGTEANADGGTDSGAFPDAPPTCTLESGATGSLCGAVGCVDTANDPANCGGCGTRGVACDAGALCTIGKCQNVAGSLSGLRWELPCTSTGTVCATDVDGGAAEVLTTTLSGAAGSTYRVTLHFRGIVEQRTYTGYDAGGALGAEADGGSNPDYFIFGAAMPSRSDTFNIYELAISDPSQTYYLNSGVSGMLYVWLIDYLATIPMKAGATVTLTADSIDKLQISNQGLDGGPIFVPGVPPYPQPYNGQFVQMDVTAVAPGP